MPDKPLNVLVVEDNLLNQKVVIFTLKRLGCQVDVADDGLTAIDKAAEKHYEVIMMDIQMPGINGYETTRRIREHEKNTGVEKPAYIIAITANNLPSERLRCFEEGMDNFLNKPFTGEQLTEMLRSIEQQ